MLFSSLIHTKAVHLVISSVAFVSKASSLNMCPYISILFFLLVCVFHLRVSVHPMHAWTCGGQKGVLDSLELESQMAVRCQVHTGKWTPVLCQGSERF